MKVAAAICALCCAAAFQAAPAQVVTISQASDQSIDQIPIKAAVDRALHSASLTSNGIPFHAVLEISQPGETASPFNGKVEVFWENSEKYRVSVTSRDFQQTRIVNANAVQEDDQGDFYPRWLRNYVRALLDPLPRADDFRQRDGRVAVGRGLISSCTSIDDRVNGITDQMTWAQVCFSGEEPLIKSVIDFTWFMDFEDYQPFGTKQIARTYTASTDNNEKLVGQLTVLEPLQDGSESRFHIDHATPPAQQIDVRFASMATNQSLLENAPTIDWPPIHEGKTEGYMIAYVMTDRTGQVREASKHNSDTPGVESFGVSQALKFKFKQLLVNGVPVQMETPLVLHFSTKIGDPIPVLTGADIAKYSSGCGYNPVLPKGLLPSGTSFKIRVSVNEKGMNTGEIFPKDIPWDVIQRAKLNPRDCRFKPYLINGQPWYHHLDFEFTAP